MMGTIFNLFIKTGDDYSLAANSTELLYKLTLFRYLMLQANVNLPHS